MSPSSSRTRNVFEPLDFSLATELWHTQFGIEEEVFSGFQFFKKAKSIWIMSKLDLPHLSFESLGMRIMDVKSQPWKPTTNALQVFGKHATKNLIHLDKEQAMVFLEGGTQEITSSCKPGYVVVFFRGDVLGCGLYSHGKLVSQMPKERRMERASWGLGQ